MSARPPCEIFRLATPPRLARARCARCSAPRPAGKMSAPCVSHAPRSPLPIPSPLNQCARHGHAAMYAMKNARCRNNIIEGAKSRPASTNRCAFCTSASTLLASVTHGTTLHLLRRAPGSPLRMLLYRPQRHHRTSAAVDDHLLEWYGGATVCRRDSQSCVFPAG